ncbi:MAG: hypothetical protein ACRDS9_11660 [Pseudonocardiaceae bacterium]
MTELSRIRAARRACGGVLCGDDPPGLHAEDRRITATCWRT